MEPGDPGRLRGFRAPGVDPANAPGSVDQSTTSSPHRSSAPDPVEHRGEVLTIGNAPTRTPPPAPRPPTDATQPAPADRRQRTPSWRWAIAAAGVLIVAMAVIATLAFELGSGTTGATSQQLTPPPATPSVATPPPVTEVYQLVAPSVVLITTSKGSLGSGVIVNDTGLILTAHHVVSGGGTVSIVFADGTKAAAKIASSNPKADIATLAPAKLPDVVVPAVLGGGVAVGSDVIAIGNPLGLRGSTTSGIVSGLERTTNTSTGRISGLIQFDAAVNPGSSGGPLLNDQGLVVGVVVSIADPGKDDAFAGIGFAVPIGTALAGGDGDGPGPGGPRL